MTFRRDLLRAALAGTVLLLAPFLSLAQDRQPEPPPLETVTSIEISAKTMKSDPGSSSAVFEGDVVARTKDMNLEAARMVVRYGESGGITTIEAEGGVKVVQGDKMIVAEQARYEEAKKMVVFRGEPKIFQKRTMVSGSEVRYFPETDQTEVSDGTVIINGE